ncbi:unnamed protein product [Macrosiphum euphorbiae]|uniref:Uncharacterized protein n=1 Tax=Macrosiphum euphorbiae TaxID=13131 RepID=A0AAV0W5W3_9HEMI|nr:unnamed protein product [Macrosiphum euphorbiae]
MECRRTVVTGGVLRSPPSVSAAPLYESCEPERCRQPAIARDRKKRSDYTDTDSDDSDASSGTDHNNAAAKATAEAAVRTIHDLLTVNRRLLALLAATVSAKAVSVSTDDKRRWQRLRNHIEECAVDGQGEKTNEDENDEFHDASATDSETSCTARVLSAERSVTRQNVLRSPPPPSQPTPPTQLETAGVQDDEGAGSEVSRLRGRCRRLERSLQQLVNTELWARNRQIGKLEQQRYVTQVAAQRDRRPAEQAVTAVAVPPQQQNLQQFPSTAAASTASPPATKGILVIRSAAESVCSTKLPAAACTKSQTAAASSPPNVATITTPPPVLPDYSEVNFFFSCDEEDDDDDNDDHDRRENSTETKSSSEEETVDSNDCKGDEEPVRLAAVGAPLASLTSTRKRHCRPHHRLMQQPIKSVGDSATVTTTTSSSTESAAAEEEADELNGDGVNMTTATATSPCTTRRHRTVSGGGGLHRRRRCRPPRRCSTCGRCSGGVDAAAATADRPMPSVADAQVQCGDGTVTIDHGCNSDRGDGELQLQQLRRELDVRRRENGRLYDMLLRLQRGTRPGDRGKGDGGPMIPSPDFSDSDPCGSPEPYRRAAGVVRGRIADLLPPLLSMRSISDDDDDDDNDGGDRSHQRYRPDGAEQQQQQQQQQLQLLTRLRERIVAYERRELNGGDDRAAAVVQQSADPSDDAVRRMNRTDLVNVALPRVVERLRRALVPLLQHRSENAVAAASVRGGSVNGGAAGGDFVIDGARSLPPSGGR